jgi:hypothetical protein
VVEIVNNASVRGPGIASFPSEQLLPVLGAFTGLWNLEEGFRTSVHLLLFPSVNKNFEAVLASFSTATKQHSIVIVCPLPSS